MSADQHQQPPQIELKEKLLRSTRQIDEFLGIFKSQVALELKSETQPPSVPRRTVQNLVTKWDAIKSSLESLGSTSGIEKGIAEQTRQIDEIVVILNTKPNSFTQYEYQIGSKSRGLSSKLKQLIAERPCEKPAKSEIKPGSNVQPELLDFTKRKLLFQNIANGSLSSNASNNSSSDTLDRSGSPASPPVGQEGKPARSKTNLFRPLNQGTSFTKSIMRIGNQSNQQSQSGTIHTGNSKVSTSLGSLGDSKGLMNVSSEGLGDEWGSKNEFVGVGGSGALQGSSLHSKKIDGSKSVEVETTKDERKEMVVQVQENGNLSQFASNDRPNEREEQGISTETNQASGSGDASHSRAQCEDATRANEPADYIPENRQEKYNAPKDVDAKEEPKLEKTPTMPLEEGVKSGTRASFASQEELGREAAPSTPPSQHESLQDTLQKSMRLLTSHSEAKIAVKAETKPLSTKGFHEEMPLAKGSEISRSRELRHQIDHLVMQWKEKSGPATDDFTTARTRSNDTIASVKTISLETVNETTDFLKAKYSKKSGSLRKLHEGDTAPLKSGGDSVDSKPLGSTNYQGILEAAVSVPTSKHENEKSSNKLHDAIISLDEDFFMANAPQAHVESESTSQNPSNEVDVQQQDTSNATQEAAAELTKSGSIMDIAETERLALACSNQDHRGTLVTEDITLELLSQGNSRISVLDEEHANAKVSPVNHQAEPVLIADSLPIEEPVPMKRIGFSSIIPVDTQANANSRPNSNALPTLSADNLREQRLELVFDSEATSSQLDSPDQQTVTRQSPIGFKYETSIEQEETDDFDTDYVLPTRRKSNKQAGKHSSRSSVYTIVTDPNLALLSMEIVPINSSRVSFLGTNKRVSGIPSLNEPTLAKSASQLIFSKDEIQKIFGTLDTPTTANLGLSIVKTGGLSLSPSFDSVDSTISLQKRGTIIGKEHYDPDLSTRIFKNEEVIGNIHQDWMSLVPFKDSYQVVFIPLNGMFNTFVYTLDAPLRFGRNNTDKKDYFKQLASLVVSRNHMDVFLKGSRVLEITRYTLRISGATAVHSGTMRDYPSRAKQVPKSKF